MNPTSLSTARSLLFVPGHRQDRFAKALATDAGGVILDLEDAVAPQDKAAAREHVRAFVQQAQPVQRARLLVRINPFDSPEHTGDLQALRSLREHPRLRARASRVTDPPARVRSAALPCLSGPAMGDCALRAPAGLWVGGWWEVPPLPRGYDAGLMS